MHSEWNSWTISDIENRRGSRSSKNVSGCDKQMFAHLLFPARCQIKFEIQFSERKILQENVNIGKFVSDAWSKRESLVSCVWFAVHKFYSNLNWGLKLILLKFNKKSMTRKLFKNFISYYKKLFKYFIRKKANKRKL